MNSASCFERAPETARRGEFAQEETERTENFRRCFVFSVIAVKNNPELETGIIPERGAN
jgi:hypothetical protein